MDALDCLLSRNSVPARLLREPAPNDGEIAAALAAGMRAPDHAALRPWRFQVIRGEARARLGDLFAAALLRREPAAGPDALEKERLRPMRSPLLIAIAAEIVTGHPKAPEIEQIVATGAAAQNIMNALHALGYGAILLTGANARDETVKAALGLAPKDHLIGFLYTGTPEGAVAQKPRPDPTAFLSEWTGPAPPLAPAAE